MYIYNTHTHTMFGFHLIPSLFWVHRPPERLRASRIRFRPSRSSSLFYSRLWISVCQKGAPLHTVIWVFPFTFDEHRLFFHECRINVNKFRIVYFHNIFLEEKESSETSWRSTTGWSCGTIESWQLIFIRRKLLSFSSGNQNDEETLSGVQLSFVVLFPRL